jgi:hypothetical protein
MKRLINTISPIIGLLVLGLFTTVLVSTFQKPTGFDSPGAGLASVSPAPPTPYYIPSTGIPPITPMTTSELGPVPWPSPTPLPPIPFYRGIYSE